MSDASYLTSQSYKCKSGSRSKGLISQNSGPIYPADKSVLLDGVNQYFTGGNVLDKGTSDAFSIVMWIRPETNSDVWLSKRISSPAGLGYALPFFTLQPRIQILGGSGGGGILVIDNASLTLSTWYHIVWTKAAGTNASTVTYYKNGASAATTISDNTLSANFTNSGDFNVGTDSSPGSSFTNAYIADLSIWNRVLTSGEVSDLYNSGSLIDYRTLPWYNSADVNAWYWMGNGPTDTYLSIADQVNTNNLTGVNTVVGTITSVVP